MRCSGCGTDVPFAGQVCPNCQRDKSSDKTATVITGMGLVMGGFIGNLVGGFGGMIIGGFALGIIAAIVAAVATANDHSAHKPPRVRVDPPPPSAPLPKAKPLPASAATSTGVEDRLRRLDRLKAEGLLSDEEHQAQRKTIIAAL